MLAARPALSARLNPEPRRGATASGADRVLRAPLCALPGQRRAQGTGDALPRPGSPRRPTACHPVDEPGWHPHRAPGRTSRHGGRLMRARWRAGRTPPRRGPAPRVPGPAVRPQARSRGGPGPCRRGRPPSFGTSPTSTPRPSAKQAPAARSERASLHRGRSGVCDHVQDVEDVGPRIRHGGVVRASSRSSTRHDASSAASDRRVAPTAKRAGDHAGRWRLSATPRTPEGGERADQRGQRDDPRLRDHVAGVVEGWRSRRETRAEEGCPSWAPRGRGESDVRPGQAARARRVAGTV